MAIRYLESSGSPGPPCPPGRERELLEDAIKTIDSLLVKPDDLLKYDFQAPKRQAISALRSLIFEDARFESALARVERIRLSGAFPMSFFGLRLAEHLAGQLRELKNCLTFIVDRLTARESKKKDDPRAAALRQHVIRLYKLHHNNKDGYVFPVCAGLDEANMPILPAWQKKMQSLGITS